MNSSNALGIGLYSPNEAARFLKVPRSTLSRWVKGYVQNLRDGVRSYEPVINRQEDFMLTFGELVELMYVREFRNSGVPLGKIRHTIRTFRDEWQTPYPLATKRFATDGQNLLLKEGDVWQVAATGQRIAFAELAKQLVHLGDLVTEWRPLGLDRSVVLDPARAFGKPIEPASGAHTCVLAQAVAAGDQPSSVAWWYGISAQAVIDASEFESVFLLSGGRAA